MAKWSDQANDDMRAFATPDDDDNRYFTSRADLNGTRGRIAAAADRNIGGGRTTARVTSTSGYTVFELDLDGNTIQSIDCIKQSDVMLGSGDWS